VATLALTIALSWALAVLMHWWPRLPTRWRRLAAIATSAAGIVFIVLGTAAEGQREAATTSMVLLGPATVTATASASASLHYYVLTVVCLLLGFTGLVFGEPLASWLRPRWVLSAVLVAWLVTVIRFLLEKTASPALLTQAVGITWMAPVAGAYFATALRGVGGGPRDLLRPLVAYAFAARGFVLLVAIVATRLHLGSHYDVSPVVRLTLALSGASQTFESGSWVQLFWLSVLPQLVVWPLYTVAAGLAGALIAWRWIPTRTPRRVPPDLSPEALASSRGRG
jgi:hypothetical protein